MSIRIYSKDVDTLINEEDIQIQKLISSGSIYSSLEECRRKYLIHKIFLAKEGKTIVGWSIIVMLKDNLKERLYEFMVYIKKSYRRKGIGRRLYNKSKTFFKLRHKEIKVYSTDRINTLFFNSLRGSFVK